MVKKKESLFPKPAPTAVDIEALRRMNEMAHKTRWERFEKYAPDLSLPWYEQVLDLESKGKPTTLTAHELAITAKKTAVRPRPGREPGWDDE